MKIDHVWLHVSSSRSAHSSWCFQKTAPYVVPHKHVRTELILRQCCERPPERTPGHGQKAYAMRLQGNPPKAMIIVRREAPCNRKNMDMDMDMPCRCLALARHAWLIEVCLYMVLSA
jgi:hypothetical protein